MPARARRNDGAAADVGAGEANFAAGQRNLADQRLEQRGLAHAVVAEHADDLVLADGEV